MELAPLPRDSQAGFSLIEIVVALGLFSLISLAGMVLVSSILQVRERTEGRLEELGDVQRALLLIASDFQQAQPKSLRVDATGASLNRSVDGRAIDVSYLFDAGAFIRTLSANGATGTRQTLLDRIKTVRWRVYLRDSGWVDAWPRSDSSAPAEDAAEVSPLALAVELDLADTRQGISGTLRRVVELAAAP